MYKYMLFLDRCPLSLLELISIQLRTDLTVQSIARHAALIRNLVQSTVHQPGPDTSLPCSDELPIIRAQELDMPTMLEQAFQLYPLAAGVAFHRFAYRAGCEGAPAHVNGDPFHAQFTARENTTESQRHLDERGWGHLQLQGRLLGDKLAVRPTLVDEFYLHFLVSARGNYSSFSHTISTVLTYIKHVRRHADGCKGLTFDDPPTEVSAQFPALPAA